VKRRIGIDVGGTNTDAVLLEDTRVVHAVKTPTTRDVTSGVTDALRQLLQAGAPASVDAVMIGTTHFTNAVVQRRDLTPVAAIRIGLPSGASPEARSSCWRAATSSTAARSCRSMSPGCAPQHVESVSPA
jgi:N-methylhydantoinase A/oxoprolinase/acetone carboxylase beta subunit